VRLSHLRKTFDRDYQEKWTKEIFKVSDKRLVQSIPVYNVVDFDDDPIKGTFYENELQRVRKDENNLWRIEKVLKRRKRNGRQEIFVKWYGCPKKLNSWISERGLNDI